MIRVRYCVYQFYRFDLRKCMDRNVGVSEIKNVVIGLTTNLNKKEFIQRDKNERSEASHCHGIEVVQNGLWQPD